MALPVVWYETKLPKIAALEMVSCCKEHLAEDKDSGSRGTIIPGINWIGSFIWYYVNKANKDNFLYDIQDFENSSLKYTEHSLEEPSYWHVDQDISTLYKPPVLGSNVMHNTSPLYEDFLIKNTETVRKLSVHVQLSDYDEYEGGNLEFENIFGDKGVAPRLLGSIIILDSRIPYQITPIEKGIKKTISCWIHGPRWK
jgi:PKHD-type hydroxylase